MIDFEIFKKGWALLDAGERREALAVVAVSMISALAAAMMVGSVLPFLSVLGDPSRIDETTALKWTYETFGFSSTFTFLVALGVGALVIIVVATVLQLLRVYAISYFVNMRIHGTSYKLLSVYLRQPYEFFLDHHSGEMGTQILSESSQVVVGFFRPAANIVASSITIIAIVALLLWVNWMLTLASFFLLGFLYFAIFYFNRRTLSNLGSIRLASNKARYRIATEALGGIKDIKLIGRERTYIDRFERPSMDMAKANIVSQVIGEMPSFVLQGVAFGGMIILAMLLVDPNSIDNGAAVGEILPLIGVFALAGQRLIPEFQRVYQGFSQLQYGKAGVSGVHEDIILNDNGFCLPNEIPLPLGLTDRIRLEGIKYRYPGSDRPSVDDIDFEISAGEKIGVVGSTGSGKTTLADLLLGLIAPNMGEIYVDGHKINSENIRAWQQTVGYVPQDIFLVDASIKENIALGVPDDQIDHARVQESCKIARLDGFIENELPQQYDTIVGERGVRLSGGQRQRIGIARALYHNADFFVFDEATSALDNLTEREVMGAINALPGDKTIVMIAHRLSTVQICDRILVLEGGQIVGFGNWDELMKNNTAFKKIALERAS